MHCKACLCDFIIITIPSLPKPRKYLVRIGMKGAPKGRTRQPELKKLTQEVKEHRETHQLPPK